MRKVLYLFLLAALLTACDLWTVQPQPFPVWTPIPSRTPGALSLSPLIATWTLTPTQTLDAATLTFVFPTDTPTATPIGTPTPAPITSVPDQPVQVDILGCNTSFDITHGMGEVTNAYVTIINLGSLDLPNTCALLRAIDEDREHPDKKRCVNNLPSGYQVTQKLTIDSVYKQDTIIQVDVSLNDVLLVRVDKQSCRDVNLFGGEPSDVGIIKPIEP